MQTEAEEELRSEIRLALQVALLGEVRPNLRGVAAARDSSTIRVRMFYDGPFGEDEIESASMIQTELIASFYPDYEVEVVAQRLDYPSPLNDVEDVDAWVYRRWEPVDD